MLRFLRGASDAEKTFSFRTCAECVAAYRNFGRCKNESEGVLVIEDHGGSRLGGSELSLKLKDVDGDGLGVVIHDIFHRELDGVAVGGFAGLSG